MMAASAGSPTFALAWRAGAFLVAAAAFWWANSLPSVYPVSDRPVPPVQAPKSEAAEAVADPDAGTPADYAAIAAHPLFSPSRTPWEPPPPPKEAEEAEAKPAAPPLDGYRLVGLVISGPKQSALIKPPNDGKTLVLQVGQELNGWKLQKVSNDKVRFVSEKETYDLAFPRPSEQSR